jgi:hypothetical protein
MAEIVEKQKVNVKGKEVSSRSQESAFAHKGCRSMLSSEAIAQFVIAKVPGLFSSPEMDLVLC